MLDGEKAENRDKQGAGWLPAGNAAPEAGSPWIHATLRGRIYLSPEFRRVVVDFKGAYLIFRPWEFRRLQRLFARLLACSWSRAGLAGAPIELRDALGTKTLNLCLDEVAELSELMDAAAARMDGTGALAI